MQTRDSLATFSSLMAFSMVFSGCSSVNEGDREFTVPEDAGDTGSQADVVEPFTLIVEVRVEHLGGDLIEGAGVAFFVTETATEYDGDSTINHRALTGARTNADGRAYGRLEPNLVVNVAVGDVVGNTTEVRSNVVLGAPGGSTTIIVPLFREELPINLTGEMPNAVGLASLVQGDDGATWLPLALRFHENDEANVGYYERLIGLDAVLRWQNSAMAYGDLYAGISVGDEVPFVTGDNEMETPFDTENEESVQADLEVLEAVRADYLEGALSLSVGTEQVAIGGVDVLFEGGAAFFSSDFVVRA